MGAVMDFDGQNSWRKHAEANAATYTSGSVAEWRHKKKLELEDAEVLVRSLRQEMNFSDEIVRQLIGAAQ